MSSSAASSQQQLSAGSGVPSSANEKQQESLINLSLLDPPRFGWTAAGGVADVLPPHERARRKAAKISFQKYKRKRDSMERNRSTLEVPMRGDGTQQSQQMATERQLNGDILDPKEVAGASAWGSYPLAEATMKSPSADKCRAKRNKSSANSTIKEIVRFSALSDSGILDIHTYHRGREGVELRDQKTGELLCDVEPTDTNFGLDEPRLFAQVTVKFPLEDCVAGGDSNKTEIRYYRENVAWDLSDPETLTPMAFAVDIAENYGLSYGQTMELAESIQSQLHSFVRDNCTYASPMILKDASGQLHDTPAPVVHALYGDVCGPQKGGLPLALTTCKRPSVSSRTVSVGRVSVDKIDKGRPASKVPAKRRRASETSKVAEEFRQEVQRRLREESCRRIREGAKRDQLVGELIVSHEMERCHLCADSKERCRSFACGNPSHAYCDMHLTERLGLAVQTDPLPLMLEHCPICSLACLCDSCTKKLDVVATDFRAKSMEQDSKTPEDTVFHDLFEHSVALDGGFVAEGEPATKRKAKGKRKEFGPVRTVDKLPVSEFPREVCSGEDMDPGTEVDYRTIYTANGTSILPETTTVTTIAGACSPATNVSTQSEDGSIDFCMTCRKHGNLLCCDFCPRAFHSSCCVESNGQTDQPEALWKCPTCLREDAGIPDEKLNGATSLALMCTAFKQSQENLSSGDKDGLCILSMIHQMLLKLVEYDFGYVFRQPVDPAQVPAYRMIVKTPMDLGTIISELVKGGYMRSADGVGFDSVITAILKDIELVWHNCYTFNCQGSAIYRMADVQRACARRIQEKSFASLLRPEIKQEVEAFRLSCERERAEVSTPGNKIGGPRSPQAPKARHKITISKKPTIGKCRPVAVLDPDTGRVVKIYTTLQSATAAVELLVSLNHNCEWDMRPSEVNGKVKRIVKASVDEPSFLLYGYRWLSHHKLREGSVTFSDSEAPPKVKPAARPETQNEGAAPKNIETGPFPLFSSVVPGDEDIEMVEGEKSTLFSTVEDALSFLGPSIDVTLARGLLRDLSPEGIFTEFGGRKWRRVVRKKQVEEGNLSLHPSLGGATTEPKAEGSDCQTTVGDVFLKEDLVAGSTLLGFDCLKAAYNDWLQALETCPAENVEPRTLETFKSFYLDGERNVGGMAWRTNSSQAKYLSRTMDVDTTQEEKKVQGFEESNGRRRHSVKDGSTAGLSRLVESNTLSGSKHADGFAQTGLISPLVSKKSSHEKNMVHEDAKVCSTN